MEKIIPLSKIEKAIQETNCAEKRNRILPTSIIILLVISLNFWSRDSVVDVWKNLVQGLMSNTLDELKTHLNGRKTTWVRSSEVRVRS